MSAQVTRDTSAELAIRRELFRRGFRYRVDRSPLPSLRRKADIVFTATKVAVFVDGCFWHSCPTHATSPKANAQWWKAKLARNVQRDRETDEALGKAGWAVVRIWEHEPVERAVTKIESTVRRRRNAPLR